MGDQFTCWKPISSWPNHFILSSIPAKGHHAPLNAYVFHSHDTTDFADPIDFNLVFHETGGKSSIWEAKCPPGYQALGQWCQFGITKPDIHNSLKCVEHTCVKVCPYQSIYNWLNMSRYSGVQALY